MTTHLYIGRFQPLHLGHLSIIEPILREPENKLLIAIGSSQEERTLENPLSFGERKKILKETLDALGYKNFQIFAVPDINDDARWVAHLNKILAQPYDILHTGSEHVKNCFALSKEPKPQIIDIDRSILPIHATAIRAAIRSHQPWQHLVHPKTAEILQKLLKNF